MALTLHTIASNRGTRAKKRLGRGNASGHGTYSGRGSKGQRARSGGRVGLKKKALKDQYLARIPKLRGFKSRRPDLAIIHTSDLMRLWPQGGEITRRVLVASKLVDKGAFGVKLLADAVLTQAYQLKVEAVSTQARQLIEAAGGQIELIVKVRTRSVLPKAERVKVKS